MGFADFYFERQKNFQLKIQDEIQVDLKFVVVIPCFNEFNLIETLDSIRNSKRIKSSIEVIVVINSSEETEQKILDQNIKTYNEAKNWIAQHENSSLRFFLLLEDHLPKKFAGAGLSRKIGMDQAVSRFNQLDIVDGVIVSMDADSKIRSNYFEELEKHFQSHSKTNAITTYFEHPIYGEEFDVQTYEAISTYELYLRYYKLALAYTKFPYSYYTIGSCFSVNVNAYVKQGGMNRKQAGEDFYFLHKIFPLGNCFEINTTCVYPSSRISDRVPFGTGPMVRTIIESGDKDFLTYNFDVFLELKSFLSLVNQFYRVDFGSLDSILNSLPECIKEFLKQNRISESIEEINRNSSNLKSFTKRFYNWFDAFRVLKFMNFAHDKYFEKKPLLHECEKLLQLISENEIVEKSNRKYLEIFRGLERAF
ncbi:MAG: glycosyltransferase [Bacteroidales bacterium]|nr:glycosyltransferase [Bacteroidales bacterium]